LLSRCRVESLLPGAETENDDLPGVRTTQLPHIHDVSETQGGCFPTRERRVLPTRIGTRAVLEEGSGVVPDADSKA
jgi:hypothetical protein